MVLGMSPDTPAAQNKFADKYDIPFPLLSDTDKKVAIAYDVLKEKNMYGKKVMGIERSTFLIKDGKIVKEFRGVKAEGHAAEVLEEISR